MAKVTAAYELGMQAAIVFMQRRDEIYARQALGDFSQSTDIHPTCPFINTVQTEQWHEGFGDTVTSDFLTKHF